MDKAINWVRNTFWYSQEEKFSTYIIIFFIWTISYLMYYPFCLQNATVRCYVLCIMLCMGNLLNKKKRTTREVTLFWHSVCYFLGWKDTYILYVFKTLKMIFSWVIKFHIIANTSYFLVNYIYDAQSELFMLLYSFKNFFIEK